MIGLDTARSFQTIDVGFKPCTKNGSPSSIKKTFTISSSWAKCATRETICIPTWLSTKKTRLWAVWWAPLFRYRNWMLSRQLLLPNYGGYSNNNEHQHQHQRLFYLMTLGTVTEYRNAGLASSLVQKCIEDMRGHVFARHYAQPCGDSILRADGILDCNIIL